jgi:hypothetical protein
MLGRQKELLNAQFARGNLDIHKKVVNLYLLNLVTVVMYALIAMAQFFGGLRRYNQFIYYNRYAGYPYLFTVMLGIYCSLMAMLLAITMYSYGYGNFLMTENHKEVIAVVRKMKLIQEQSAQWAFAVLVCIVFEKWIPTWGLGQSLYLFIGQSVIIFVGFYCIIHHGKMSIEIFSEHSRGGCDLCVLTDI